MKVYVVCYGERGEGQSPISVHSTRPLAMLAAQKVMDRRGNWAYQYEEPDDNGFVITDEWHSGCDILLIREFEVHNHKFDSQYCKDKFETDDPQVKFCEDVDKGDKCCWCRVGINEDMNEE